MWKIKNGLLCENDRPQFAIGLSYYPSYREDKVPVPPDGDRIGEMQKDLRGMAENGFNIVRFAALGDIRRENGEIHADTTFMDALMAEADTVGLATMLRLQGYTMNLSGYTDCYMLDENGQQLDRSVWYNFIQNSLHHAGILADNAAGTAYLAAHYRRYAGLVAYQTYNEPHYPAGHIYDYHPAAIAAFRRYLVEKGLLTADAAAVYDPPRHKPYTAAEREPWAIWREFALYSHSRFLRETAAVAKEAAPDAASLTCLTTCPVNKINSLRCVDYYDNARDMDIVGITHYIGTHGPEFFHADLAVNFAECAAAFYGKHCWIVEYDARTDIPDRKFNEETYLALGAGIKGILYYQWRADYPAPGAPEANGFGFLNYDGTHAQNYDNGMRMVQFLHRLSGYLTGAEKYRSPVGLLYSNHAYFMSDVSSQGDAVWQVPFQQTAHTLGWAYAGLKKLGVTATVVIADAVRDNRFGLSVLLVPEYALLSAEEKAAVSAFAVGGGHVYIRQDSGFSLLGRQYDKFDFPLDFADVLAEAGVQPPVESTHPAIVTNMVCGEGYRLLSINNVAAGDTPVTGAALTLHFPAKSATLLTPTGDTPLGLADGHLSLPPITDGGMVYIAE